MAEDSHKLYFNPMTFCDRPRQVRASLGLGPRGQYLQKRENIQLSFWQLYSHSRIEKKKERCPWLLWRESCQEIWWMLQLAKDIPKAPLTLWHWTRAALNTQEHCWRPGDSWKSMFLITEARVGCLKVGPDRGRFCCWGWGECGPGWTSQKLPYALFPPLLLNLWTDSRVADSQTLLSPR